MPQYKVTKKAFFNGKLYDPEGKRRVLTVDKPFSKELKPSWVEPLAAPRKPAKKSNKEPDFAKPVESKSVETL